MMIFDHGGDSLLAEQAATQLEELLGHAVPAALLYHGRNAGALAPIVQRQDRRPAHVMALQAGGEAFPYSAFPIFLAGPSVS
ncbi:acyl carrier protein [Komagataeibacter rhaeticus]|nr:acyl carrier protein [Komagataeibacter rhaeticus]